MKLLYKKFLACIAILVFICTPVFSEQTTNKNVIDNVDLSKYFPEYNKKEKKNSKKEIESLIKTLKHYTATKNIDGLEKLISDTFVNNDGFSKKDCLELFKKLWEEYPNMTHSYQIKEIKVNEDWATVWMEDKAVSKVGAEKDLVNKNGIVKCSSEYILYLQRFGYDWKIQSETILEENAIVTYGDAKFLELKLDVPTVANRNTDYSAKLSVKTPKDYVVFASLDNEKIELETETRDNLFKTLATDGVLERIVHANNENKNETLVASIGIAKPTISENNDNSINIKVDITGMALVMRRVNVINQKQNTEKL